MRRCGLLALLLLTPLSIALLLGTPPTVDAFGDFVLHASVAAALSLSIFLTAVARGPRLLALIGALMIGALASEAAQALLTRNRTASIEDLLADGSGLLLGLLIYLGLLRQQDTRRPR